MNSNYGYEPTKKSAADYRELAWERLTGRYWWAVLAGLIASFLGVTAASGGASFNISLPSESEGLPGMEIPEVQAAVVAMAAIMGVVFVTSLVTSLAFGIFVTAPVSTGYARFNLAIADEEKPVIGMLFRYFKLAYGKSMGVYIQYQLRILLCMVPALLAVLGYGVMAGVLVGTMSLDFNELINLGNVWDLGWIMTLLICGTGVVLIGYVISAVLTVIASYKYSMCYNILADNPDMTAREALNRSAELMKGNKWRLFCLRFSFIGWTILAVMTCGVGMVFLVPYVQAAEAVFYRDLTGGAAKNDFTLVPNGTNRYTFGDGTFSN